jgi:hypothetical protein
MATQQDTQQQDPNQILRLLLSTIQSPESGGGSAYGTPEQGLTEQSSAYGMNNANAMSQPMPQADYSNQRKPGSGLALQLGSSLAGQLIKGVIGSGVSNYVGGKLADMNAKTEAARIKEALPDASPAAIKLLSGGGEVTQALGKSMLANQFTPTVRTLTDVEQKLQAAGFKPNTPEYQNAIKQVMFGPQDLQERKFQYDQNKSQEENARRKQEFDYKQKQDAITNANMQTDNARQFNATQFQQENALSTSHTRESQNFVAIRNATKNVFNALETATTSAPATLAAGTAFMKLLDPGSVVRESELGMALQAQGVFDRIGNMLNIVQNGKTLTAAQAAEFKDLTKKIYNAAEVSQKQLDAQYTGRAVHYGLDPKNVVTNYYPGSEDVTPAAKSDYEEYKKTQGMK